MNISVVLATYNEEENIGGCLNSVKDLASEIIVVDGTSSDRTVEIAKKYTKRVVVTANQPIFHINKQKAINMAKGDWILQLDADERVTDGLANEIKNVIGMNEKESEEYQKNLSGRNLFLRHEKLIKERDGEIGTETGGLNAFFIPRLNYFLGKYLKYGGVYPDGVIRLIKRGKARFPCKSVHEQIQVEGRVGWLQNPLLHIDSPTFKRYLEKNNRYINLIVKEFKEYKVKKNFINAFKYFFVMPFWWFFLTQIRHKGFLDGVQGIIFSFFSALRFSRAYYRYIKR